MAVQYAFGKIVTQGLDLNVDAADPTSYPGSGTSWTSVVNRSITGSLVSCSFSSDFKGGIVFNNPSASVVFPGTVANYGTGSFTIEMAFRPSSINGIHYLVSKNSGSFPNWGVYLSGSGGAGKLFAEYRINASVSCSVSSSTTFVTGSVYQADIVLAPGLSGSGMSVDGVSQGTVLANGGGSLTSTSSLFVGSYSTNPIQNFSGSIYLVRAYSTTGFTLPVVNYNTTSTRFSKTPISETAKKQFELLVVAGGGGSVTSLGGGGGAGGLQYFSSITPSIGRNIIIVGNGGSSGQRGQNSSFGSFISFGGGASAGGNNGTNAVNADGGSGGGAGFGNGVPGTGSIGQGNSGGTGTGGATAAGGGGASQSGRAHNDPTAPGAGGSGSFISSFAPIGGSPAGWFAGGGGGGTGAGGIGGGGIGGTTPGTPGVINTGGGAGGPAGSGAQGAAGGSGIVAIRYNGTPIALGGEITQSAGFTYHVFRTVGTSSFTIF
jgi:hypothetical protein